MSSTNALLIAFVLAVALLATSDACTYFASTTWTDKKDNFLNTANAGCKTFYDTTYATAGSFLWISNSEYTGTASQYLVGNIVCLLACLNVKGQTTVFTKITALIQPKAGTTGDTAANVELLCFCENDTVPQTMVWETVETTFTGQCPVTQ